jgi:hypothetical protein
MMRKFCFRAFFIALLSLVVIFMPEHVGATESLVVAHPKSVFPAIKLTSLDQSKSLTLPRIGKQTFLAIGFHPNTQPKLEAAITLVQNFYNSPTTSLDVFEIPVVEVSRFPNNSVTRFFMKQQIRNKTFLPVVYPYYTNLRAFQSRLGLSESETMVFLLIDKNGHVVWSKKTSPVESEMKAWKALLK